MIVEKVKTAGRAFLRFLSNKLVIAGAFFLSVSLIGADPLKDYAVGKTTVAKLRTEIWNNAVGFVHNPLVCLAAAFLGLWLISKGVNQTLQRSELEAVKRIKEAMALESEKSLREAITIPILIAVRDGMASEFREYHDRVTKLKATVDQIAITERDRWAVDQEWLTERRATTGMPVDLSSLWGERDYIYFGQKHKTPQFGQFQPHLEFSREVMQMRVKYRAASPHNVEFREHLEANLSKATIWARSLEIYLNELASELKRKSEHLNSLTAQHGINRQTL